MEKQVIINFSFTQEEALSISEVLQKLIYETKRIGFVKDLTDDQMAICREMYESLVGDLNEKDVTIKAEEGQIKYV